ncbi:MAG TPA: A24 family peptidase [Vicinamibacterales bacterium]
MPSDALALTIVVAGVSTAAAIDVRTRRVPNALTMSLAGAGLVLATSGLGRVELIAALAGGLVGLLLMLPGHLLGATGGGDVKLLAATGTLLGPAATLWAFLVAMIAGGALALIVAAHRRRLWLAIRRSAELVRSAGDNAAEIEDPRADNGFAYAPAIAVGAILAGVFV